MEAKEAKMKFSLFCHFFCFRLRIENHFNDEVVSSTPFFMATPRANLSSNRSLAYTRLNLPIGRCS
jgi:hypothetical protein